MPTVDDLFSVTTPIDGRGPFSLASLEGEEGLSRLFRFRLELISSNTAVGPVDLVGKGITVAVAGAEGKGRYFHGIVRRLAVGGLLDRARSYIVELVPWLWFLTRTADCRIYQNLSTPAIVEQVFGDLGFSDYRSKLGGSYSPREYCVQYRETAFDFVSRLLEEEGIYYYFRHEEGKHTLILADDISGYAPCPESEAVYVPIEPGVQPSDRIIGWQHGYEFRSGKFTLDDYNFEKPTNKLLASSPTTVALPGISAYEVFDYPGLYQETDAGATLAGLRVGADEAAYDVVEARSTYRTFAPAGTFTVKRHTDASEVGKSFVITAIGHSIGGVELYRNRFEAIPSSAVYRPEARTPRPMIRGTQTAAVVGSSGEEIWPDKYGRIKVQFHWDRLGKDDENSSCWIRCAQAWTGAQWGVLFLPRIGQEVVVSFLEGNPDRPLVIGTVANADEMPAYALPANKTRSYIRTRSSKQGDSTASNEIRFEDLKDSEELYIHAQKDLNEIVENDRTLTVGSSKAKDGSQAITVYKDRTIVVQTGNESTTLQKGNRTVEIDQGNDALTIQQGNRTVQISKGNDALTIQQGNRTVQISKGNDALTIQQGNLTIQMSAGSGTIEAAQTITLKVGSNSIVISTSGITVKGATVSVQGQSEVQVQAPSIQVSASGVLALKGGVVNIN
jgi:type VI secretion system secreted protein VgrG